MILKSRYFRTTVLRSYRMMMNTFISSTSNEQKKQKCRINVNFCSEIKTFIHQPRQEKIKTNETETTSQSAIIRNIHGSRSVHIQRHDLLLTWPSVLGICNSFRSLCHASECTSDSTDSRSPISSIWLSGLHRQSSPARNSHTVLD